MKFFASLFLCLTVACASAQQADSIVVTIQQAEEIFLKKNLLLLASRYQVDAAKANEIQEKLYPNPTFSTDLATYGDNRKWFDIGRRGQKQFGLDQLILLAGKRNKRVQLAREQTRETALAFYDLLRTLKYELRASFYTQVYATELATQYTEQLQWLQQLIDSYEYEAGRRNVSLKDAVRLKSEYLQLSADRNAVIMDALNAQQTLQLLLDTTVIVMPSKEEWTGRPLPSRDLLLETAKKERADLRMKYSQVKQEELNYRLQKAMAIPDVTVGAGYDQDGNYVSNFYSMRASIDLPLFNRNQGQIKQAKAQIRVAELEKDYKELTIEKEVFGSYARLLEAEKEYQFSQSGFNKDFPAVNRSVLENFNKGNMSMLEFMDFFQNYNTAMRQVNELRKQRRLAWEELEYVTGASLD
ncbi:TolC family protein [Nostoc ellipsosporum NOK]|jgi:cobalt-zinc-cadmium efflux system outer membrane protein|nr:TolC family protein [Nostoc ellipsosporum NOK]